MAPLFPHSQHEGAILRLRSEPALSLSKGQVFSPFLREVGLFEIQNLGYFAGIKSNLPDDSS